MDNNNEAKKNLDQQGLIANQIIAIVRSLGCKFKFKDQEISIERAFGILGLLPAIARRADQLCQFCMGYGLGVTFDRVDGSILGVSVEFDNKVPISLRLLCITDVILEIVHSTNPNELVELDFLVE